MRHQTGSNGAVVSFYSYKGGTGRSMALANIGCLLANRGNGVLMVDWDLEAPGLHRYFRDLVKQRFPNDANGEQFEKWPGLIDYFQEVARLVESCTANATEDTAKSLIAQVPLDRYLVQTDIASLYLLKAGCFDRGYASYVDAVDWKAMHGRQPWLFGAFAEALSRRFRYVLIDSRTGITDTSGVCTSIMPDILVPVFTPNRQSLLGAVEVANQAASYRKNSDDLRPFTILPLASRIEGAEPVLRDLWRFGDREQGIPGYQPAFESLFRAVYDLPACDLGDYFSEIQLQHIPRYAYGEQIAVRIESGDRLSLTRSFEYFAERLACAAPAWESPREECGTVPARPESQAPIRDDAWLERQRAAALVRLAEIGASGFLEAAFFRPPPAVAFVHRQLFQAAQSAQVPGTGWPIGAVVSTNPESRPRPTQEGIAAEIVDGPSQSFDYWALRADGAFYFLRNFFEGPVYLLAEDCVERVAELLLYCFRLYSSLQVDPATRVRIAVTFHGFSGRELGGRNSETPDSPYMLAGAAVGDRAQGEAEMEIGRIRYEILDAVRNLTRPLFAMFEFFELPAGEYQRVIGNRLQDWGIPWQLAWPSQTIAARDNAE